MSQMKDELRVNMEGHLRINGIEEDGSTVELLNKRNAIHKEHASILIARGLGGRENGYIYSMHFGTGGSTIDPLGNITYASPNVVGAADLNQPVYFETVNDNQGGALGNQMAIRHLNGTSFTDVEIRCVIDRNEPYGQAVTDNGDASNINTSVFVFDEIGLKTSDGLLITHVVFSPIEKTANRIIEVIYTIRVALLT